MKIMYLYNHNMIKRENKLIYVHYGVIERRTY